MEKRNHSRHPAKLSLKYRLLQDSPPKLQFTQSIDVSNGGMGFRNSQFVPQQTPILVEFTPPNLNHRLALSLRLSTQENILQEIISSSVFSFSNC